MANKNTSTAHVDRIILRRIPFNLHIGPDQWNCPKAQPVIISLEMAHDIQASAAGDDVSLTIDYAKLYRKMQSTLEGKQVVISSLGELIIAIPTVMDPVWPTKLEVTLPKANLRAEGGLSFMYEYEEQQEEGKWLLKQDFGIRGIRCACIIGVNPYEREERQIIIVNLNFKSDVFVDSSGLPSLNSLRIKERISTTRAADIVREVVKVVENSSYQTLESLATAVAKVITMKFEDEYELPGVWVEVQKPNAIAAIEASGVRIFRQKSFFSESNFWQIKRP